VKSLAVVFAKMRFQVPVRRLNKQADDRQTVLPGFLESKRQLLAPQGQVPEFPSV